MNWKDILIIVGILITVVGCLFAIEYLEMPKKQAKLPEEKIAKELPKPIEITEEYQSYYNEEYGYTIEYPNNWKRIRIPYPVEEMEHAMFFYPQPSESFLPKSLESFKNLNAIMVGVHKKVFTYEKVKELTEETVKREKGKILEIKEIIINNLNGYESTVFYEAENIKTREIIFPLKDKSYNLACSGEVTFYDKYCDKIINSFSIKEIKPKGIVSPEELPELTKEEVAGWQIFSEFGFSLKIPPDYFQKVFRKVETGLIADYRNNEGERILITYQILGKEAIDIAKNVYRNFISKAENLKGKTVEEIKEILEEEVLLHLILISYFTEDSQLISAQEIKKENCPAFALTFETGTLERRKSLEIFPLASPEFVWTIVFFYSEKNEARILKVMQTIECKSR
jgi:hypothetical protein